MAPPPECKGGSCELFGPFGLFVQALIGAWCVFTLLVLWRLETPRRPLLTWLGDMSKQMVGAGWGHFMNLFVAVLFGKALEKSEDNNQCVWYLVGFMSDILFVTFLCWAVTTAVRPLIHRRCGIDIGDYDGTSSGTSSTGKLKALSPWVMWLLQTAIWLAIMTLVKAVVSLGVFVFQDFLYSIFALAFRTFGLCHHERAQLVVSVIVVPIVGDAFQFAVQDGFLKRRNEETEPLQQTDMQLHNLGCGVTSGEEGL